MPQKRLKTLILWVGLFSLILLLSAIVLSLAVHSPSVQAYLLEKLSHSLGYEVKADKLALDFSHGIGINGRNFKVFRPSGEERVAADRIGIVFNLRELIRGNVVPKELLVIAPSIHLMPGKNPFETEYQERSDSADKKLAELMGVFPKVHLQEARVTVGTDDLVLKNLNLSLEKTAGDPLVLSFRLKGTARSMGAKALFSSNGQVRVNENQLPWFDANFSVKEMGLAPFSLPQDLLVKSGLFSMEGRINGSPEKMIQIDGTGRFKNLDFVLIDDGDKKGFSFKSLVVPIHAVYGNGQLKIPSFEVQHAAFNLKGTSTFDFTNPHDPHLNLRVESPFMKKDTFIRIFPSSLLPRWLETRIFPIFSGGNVRVDRFSLDGPWSGLQNLDLQQNAHLLYLQLTCNELTAFKGDQGMAVEEVSGLLKIQEGEIHVSQVKGRFGKSQIYDGSLFLKDLYVDDPHVRVTAEGLFDVQDLLKQADLTLIPEVVQSNIREIETASGKLDGNVEIIYEPGWSFPRIQKAFIHLADCTLTDPEVPFPIMVKEGDLNITQEGGRQFTAEGYWGQSGIKVSGNLGSDWRTGEAHISAMADMDELLGHFYPDLKSSLKFKSKIPCQVALSKKKSWSFHGALDLKQSQMETKKLIVAPFGRDGGVLFSGGIVPGKKFFLRNLQCNLGGSSLTLKGFYNLQNRDDFEFNISSRKLGIKDLGITFKKGGVNSTGSLVCDVSVSASRKMPTKTRLNGDMSVRGLTFSTTAFPYPVKDCDFDLHFSGKDVIVDTLSLKMGKTPFRVKGQFQGWDGMRGHLDIHSDFLDMNDLLPGEISERFKTTDFEPAKFQKEESTVMAPGWKKEAHHFVESSDLHFDITASRVQWQDSNFGPLDVECGLINKDLYVKRSSIKFNSGKLLLRGHLKRGKKPEMLFTSYLEMTHQPVRELPKFLDFIKNRLEGRLTLETLLFAKGNSKKEMLKSLTGSANILMEEGVIKKSNLFIKILDDMSLSRMFKERPPDLSKEGLYFDRIGAHLNIEEGIAKSTNMGMESPVFNAVGEGLADLNSGSVDAEIGVHPMVSADYLVSKIPILGYFLRGDDDTVVAEYFKVTGPISDPDVRYMTFKSMSNGTYSFFKRLILSPKRLFENISEAAKEFEEKGLPLPDESLQPEYEMAR